MIGLDRDFVDYLRLSNAYFYSSFLDFGSFILDGSSTILTGGDAFVCF